MKDQTPEIPKEIQEWIEKEYPLQEHPDPDGYGYPNCAVMSISRNSAIRAAASIYHHLASKEGRGIVGWVKASDRMPKLTVEEDIIFRNNITKCIYGDFHGYNPTTKDFYFEGRNDDVYIPLAEVEWLDESPSLSSLQSEITKLKADKETMFKAAEYWTGKFEEVRKEAHDFREALFKIWNARSSDFHKVDECLTLNDCSLIAKEILAKYPNRDKR